MGVAALADPGDALAAPKVALKTLKATPWLAVGIFAVVLVSVLAFETWKPGFFTGPIRRGLQKLGLKGA